jgi:hypothetical protein
MNELWFFLYDADGRVAPTIRLRSKPPRNGLWIVRLREVATDRLPGVRDARNPEVGSGVPISQMNAIVGGIVWVIVEGQMDSSACVANSRC